VDKHLDKREGLSIYLYGRNKWCLIKIQYVLWVKSCYVREMD